MDENKHLQDGVYQAIRHELRDVSAGPIVTFAISLFLLVAFSFWITRLMFNHFAAREAKSSSPHLSWAGSKPALPPEPRLQVSPAQDRRQLRDAEEQVLHSYGWVNQPSGVVRIPIERAMQLIAERGLPATPASEESRPTGSTVKHAVAGQSVKDDHSHEQYQ
jgi:hypothetical protein